MKQEGEITVIIPVFKVEQYLDRCVKSVVNQTYENLEIILVDDGSPDFCPQQCDLWSKKDSRIHVIHKDNGGLSSARNAALDIARGKYIYFLDSDDFITRNAMEVLISAMSENEADIVSSAFTEVPDGVEDNIEDISAECVFLTYSNIAFYSQKISNHACGKLYDARLFQDIRYPLNRNYEDIATTYKVYDKAKKVLHTDTGIYFYRMREEGISHVFSKKNIEDLKWAYQKIKEYYRDPCETEYYYELTVLYTLYSRLLRSDHDKDKELLVFIRSEFNNISKYVKLTNFKDSPMVLKLALYKWHLVGVVVWLTDKYRKIRGGLT